jgi:hypothetical protein
MTTPSISMRREALMEEGKNEDLKSKFYQIK